MAIFAKLCALLAFGSCIVTAEPIVTIKQSPAGDIAYRGSISDSIEHFQNIKYAHDTSGAHRFAPPEPYIPPWGTEMDATTPGAACPQLSDAIPLAFVETKDMREDCLSLRIARPAGTNPGAKLPVVVWLHGGGVVKGSAYDPHFQPDRMINYSKTLGKPVIYVALNYRLSIFGFARLPILKEQKSMNVGMRDQRAGFQWIKDNIEAFGGDPSRITVYGLSAGATFSSMHLLSYGGEKGVPFTQLWGMSGPPGTALNMTSDATEIHTQAVARKVGCEQSEDNALLECLREVPMQKLLDVAMQYSAVNHPPVGLFNFIPSIDGDMFNEQLSVSYKKGRFVKGIPSVFGWTEDDGTVNAGPVDLIQEENDMVPLIKELAYALNATDISKLLNAYKVEDFEDDLTNYEEAKGEHGPAVSIHYFRLARILRDLLFTCSSMDFASEIHKQSRDLDSEFPGAWLYVLNQTMYEALWKSTGTPYLGVCHGSDTNYIFNGLFLEGEVSAKDKRLSNQFTESFINFAYTGNPNTEDLEGWPTASHMQSFAEETSSLHNIHVQVIGGPFGTGPATVDFSASDPDNFELFAANNRQDQQHLQGYQMGSASLATGLKRTELLAREKLKDRCTVISSLAEKLGV